MFRVWGLGSRVLGLGVPFSCYLQVPLLGGFRNWGAGGGGGTLLESFL